MNKSHPKKQNKTKGKKPKRRKKTTGVGGPRTRGPKLKPCHPNMKNPTPEKKKTGVGEPRTHDFKFKRCHPKKTSFLSLFRFLFATVADRTKY